MLPAGGRQWKLATPPDVATNGAFAVSVTGAQSLAAGVRPSQLLRFSPVTSTANGGRTWQAGPPDPGLAEVPDALAAAPQGGQLLALDRTGRVEQGRTGVDHADQPAAAGRHAGRPFVCAGRADGGGVQSVRAAGRGREVRPARVGGHLHRAGRRTGARPGRRCPEP